LHNFNKKLLTILCSKSSQSHWILRVSKTTSCRMSTHAADRSVHHLWQRCKPLAGRRTSSRGVEDEQSWSRM